MDIKHRFWRFVALALARLATERRRVVATSVIFIWLGGMVGMLYLMLG